MKYKEFLEYLESNLEGYNTFMRKARQFQGLQNATTMYLWVKYTTASRVYIHLVAKAVRIESAMG